MTGRDGTSAGRWPSIGLFLRSLLWTLLLPGFFAGFVPWQFFGLYRVRLQWSSPRVLVALFAISVGVALLAVCIVEFARRGRGTLSPVDPPRHLVVRGPYRYVRNPMYLSVTLIVLGQVLLTRSRELALYCIVWFIAVNLFVMGYEEPTLHQQFGDSYDEYRRKVRRWIPGRP